MLTREQFILNNIITIGTTLLLDTTTTSSSMDMSMCDNGALASEQSIPGAYASDCIYLPTRTFVLQSTNVNNVKNEPITLTVAQGATRDASVSGRTGVALWNSCLLLTRLLDVLNISQGTTPTPFKDQTVLELGVGTAAASIAAYKMGAKQVIATDGNPEVVALAQRNIVANIDADIVMDSNGNKSIKAEQLNWGFMDAIDYSNVADFIIGSDLTYNSGTWKILAETIATILKPKTGIFLYLTLGHSGFSSVGEVTGFVSVAEAEGLYVVKEGSKDWPFGKIPSSSGTLKGLLMEKCLRNQAERDVLAGTGGVQVLVMKRK